MVLSRPWIFFLDWNGGFLWSKFPDVGCGWFGSISVTANMWPGLSAVLDLDVPRVSVASRRFTGIMLQNWLAAPQFPVSWVAALFVAVYALAVVCWLQFPADWQKGRGCACYRADFAQGEFWSAHCSHLNYTWVQLRQCSCLKMAASLGCGAA